MRRTLFLIVILLSTLPVHSQKSPDIIPIPVKMQVNEGAFTIDAKTSIHFNKKEKELKDVAAFLTGYIRDISGIKLSHNSRNNKRIIFKESDDAELGMEGYHLKVTSENILIEAANGKGIFYGIQSLLQTLPAIRTNASLEIPAMEITDHPRFQWRGMMLDVSRHFYSPEAVKQYIDLLATYKFNTFHWHLVDDPGWRIEIKKYPKLTEIGAWRVDHLDKVWSERSPARDGEEATYGGYYTQEQIKEIVAYAQKRNITIVPEIELPAHSVAALAAYPEFSCTEGPQLVNTGGIYPKGIQSAYCPGKDKTFDFLEDIFLEVLDLFPSEYIHIGGDELDKSQWEKCDACQSRINEEDLANEDGLQSYMVKRIEKFLNAHGRKLIGWDEILEGGLAPGATVMSWRGEAGGIKAAKMGHDVVMTPGSPCYFDHYQAGPEGEPTAIGGMNTLKDVYEYEPIPEELNAEEAQYVLGAQANVWTEYIATLSHLEYMVLPRMLALSEVVWSPASHRDWEDFNNRLRGWHFRAFDQKGYHYNKGNSKVIITPQSFDGKLLVELESEIVGAGIVYTLDGSRPESDSKKYSNPVEIKESATIKASTLLKGEVPRMVPASQAFEIHKAVGQDVSYKNPVSRYYMADGPNSLTDGIRGTFTVGKYWHGFHATDMVATIDLGNITDINRLSVGILQKRKDWIFPATSVTFEISGDGKSFSGIETVESPIESDNKENKILNYSTHEVNSKARYIRITARNFGVCPVGHPGEGKPTWLFVDEIVVK